ncbi:MAG: dienelactone hydrolase family protein [Acidimicrobiales bacterium]
MALRDYLVSEIAVDHADGLLTRREALRRLGLMGLGAAAAGSVLAACSGNDAGDTAAATSAGGSSTTAGTGATTAATAPATSDGSTTSAAATHTSSTSSTTASAGAAAPITFGGPAGTLMGAYAGAAGPSGGLLIIHENRGLTPHFQSMPDRFAAAGLNTLALDLLSRVGGTAGLGDDAAATAALGNAAAADLIADMRAGLDELARRTPGKKLAIMGFCFGGGQVWSLLNAGEPRLAAAIPCYGPGPANANFSGSPNAAVMGVYAELDTRVNASRDAMEAALTTAGLTHELRTYPGADHAFLNDTGARYNPTQATAALADIQAWLTRHLA